MGTLFWLLGFWLLGFLSPDHISVRAAQSIGKNFFVSV